MTIEANTSAADWRSRLGHRWQSHEKFRFLVIGACNTVFGYLVFVGAFVLLRKRLHYLVILILAHFISVLCAFLGHKFLTFKAQGHLIADFLRFNLTYLGALALGMLGLPFLVEVCRIHPLISQAFLIIISTVGTYVMHKKISFRRV